MKSKKKVLMLSMLSGFGHIRAGEALLDYAKESISGVKAEHVDVCDIDPAFKAYAKMYDAFVRRFPFLWRLIYNYLPVSIAKHIIFLGNFMSNKVLDYVKKEKPDIVIFTNVTIAPIFVSDFRKMFGNMKMAVLVTDYHAHPYYVFKELDYYFVPHQKVKNGLIAFGVDKQKIVPSGIPINPRFYIKQSIKGLKIEYGINNNLPVVLLIASFRMSSQSLLYLVKRLLQQKPEINLLFVANGKQPIYDLINNIQDKRLKVVNWTNVMEEYIKVSDVVITKAGGLTVTECLTIKKPMIMVNSIPGQEEHNAAFVQENNFGVKVKNVDDIIKVLPKFISLKDNKKNLLPTKNPCQEIFQILLR